MSLEMDYVRAVCKIGQGHACCRYLTCGPTGFNCEKYSQLRPQLDARAFAGDMIARGDNCQGMIDESAIPGCDVLKQNEDGIIK